MGIWILFCSVAIVVAIVGCATIWRFDRRRADEISHDRTRFDPQPAQRPLRSATVHSDEVDK
jgi:hypothetical protein